jgi:hypothetical protein
MINAPNVANESGRNVADSSSNVSQSAVELVKTADVASKVNKANLVADGQVDLRPVKTVFLAATGRPTSVGSTLPAEFDGLLADIRQFGSEINRIKDQLSKTTDPAERAALFAELQFNMNQQSETISMMSKMLQDLHQNAQAILQNIGR